jgi:CubicO group peptidase (beta-lactamase class C family)
MALASCTKIVTNVAILQLVEQGQIGLDDDVSVHLPELSNLKIIAGFQDGQPILVERKNVVTLRYVVTLKMLKIVWVDTNIL